MIPHLKPGLRALYKVRQFQALQILQATENCCMGTKINKPDPFLKLHRITIL